jgi:hypothetical protein
LDLYVVRPTSSPCCIGFAADKTFWARPFAGGRQGVQAEDEIVELLYASDNPRERSRIVVVSKMI